MFCGCAALRGNLLLAGVFAAYFWLVYWAGNFVALHATRRFQVALPFKALIPFVPWTAAIYLTIMPLLWLAPFILRTPRTPAAFVRGAVHRSDGRGCRLLHFPGRIVVPGPRALGLAKACSSTSPRDHAAVQLRPSRHVASARPRGANPAARGGRRSCIWCWAAAIMADAVGAPASSRGCGDRSGAEHGCGAICGAARESMAMRPVTRHCSGFDVPTSIVASRS